MTRSSANKTLQLIAMLRKPNGVRVSVIVERLGWQSHTVRAAISGLRKKGFDVLRTKAKKSGEAVYSIKEAVNAKVNVATNEIEV